MADEESLAQVAYHRLEEDIVTLKLKPGEAITEARLTAELGMGRTPIREAIQRLSWEGLLTIRPRLGMVIAEINPGDFTRVMEARHSLEVLLCGAAARLASKDERKALQVCAGRMRDAAADSDVIAFLRLDKEFDEIVARAACNPFAAKAVGPLQTLSRRYWFRYLGDADLEASAQGHLELMLAIEAGNERDATSKAEGLMQHFRRQAASLVAEVEWL
ncbi:GntR family transcriptional regulator [Roseibium suaedae]|uniref:DNA-binding transcriptional regulator, GntR family n=1 Tax=Roseibium suaedae TaxID=735517 RepID=A0A1M7IJQ3_9HYPH|nr:GntR family transcriptional regulator [Roseibium suaedae]SHM40838.1 DNA-binding transcriptional regulator, GntR family [Roseibium suaedae]